MAVSSSSAVCTWLVAACMSLACDKEMNSSSMIQSSPSRRWGRRRSGRGVVSSKCIAGGSTGEVPRGLISSFCGSKGIQGLITSLEPCHEYYTSKGLCDNGFASLFGSRNAPSVNRRQRRSNRAAAHFGNRYFSSSEYAVEYPCHYDYTIYLHELISDIGFYWCEFP